MGWLNGRVDDLAPEQRNALIAQQRDQSRRYVVVLFLVAPVLFLIGGVRELLLNNPTAWKQVPWRFGLSLLTAGLGLALRQRQVSDNLASWAAIIGIGLINIALVWSVQTDPNRMALVHVVEMLLAMIILPLVIRRSDTLIMAAVLALPMVGLLVWHQASPAAWWTALSAVALGVWAGLYMRRQRLEIALELFKLRNQLELRAEIDMLTGLLNREGWFRHAREIFTLSRDTRKPMAVAYLDLDHFKRINDEFGHGAGDHALTLVADVLRRHTRSQDITGRLGGEEFVLLMQGLLEQPALRIVQDLGQAVRAIPFQRQITFSAGICQVRTTETLEDAMRRADQALLEAKREGRDRILRAR